MDTSSKRYYERLTQDNAALLLVDHQIGFFTGIRDLEIAQLKHNVVGLAKAAQVLGVPIIATTTSRRQPLGADDSRIGRRSFRNRHYRPLDGERVGRTSHRQGRQNNRSEEADYPRRLD